MSCICCWYSFESGPFHSPAHCAHGGEAVLVALARGLAQGSGVDWQRVVSKLLHVFHVRAALPDPVAPPTIVRAGSAPLSADRELVRGAHTLLRAMLLLGARDRVEERWLFFVSGMARWLAAALRVATEPLTAAHVLGVALRASALCIAGARGSHCFVLRATAHQQSR